MRNIDIVSTYLHNLIVVDTIIIDIMYIKITKLQKYDGKAIGCSRQYSNY